MCLFDFVEEDYAVRFASDRFSQLTSFIVAHISRRRTNQSGNRVLFHVFGHVDSNNILFTVEKRFGQCLGQFGFPYSGRSQEDEGTDWPVFILQARSGSENCFRHGCYAFILTDDSLMENFRQFQQFISFSFDKFRHRDTGPSGYHFCDFFFGNFFLQETFASLLAGTARRSICSLAFRSGLFFLQLLFQFRQNTILQLCQLFQVIFTFCIFHLMLHVFNLLLQDLYIGNALLFILPLGTHGSVFFLQCSQFFFQSFQTSCRCLVGFLAQSLLFNFQLHDFAADFVQFCRHAVDFRTNSGSRFVHQVDGLVRQKTVADIAVR